VFHIRRLQRRARFFRFTTGFACGYSYSYPSDTIVFKYKKNETIKNCLIPLIRLQLIYGFTRDPVEPKRIITTCVFFSGGEESQDSLYLNKFIKYFYTLHFKAEKVYGSANVPVAKI